MSYKSEQSTANGKHDKSKEAEMGKWEKRVGMTTRAIRRPPGSAAPRPGLPWTDSHHILPSYTAQHCDYALSPDTQDS